jgi:hypothetical protein
MRYRSIGTSVLLALLVSAGLTAQTTPTFETALTTGVVGWAPGTQTAQLNVLNLNGFVAVAGTSTSTTTPAATCPMQLQFVDAQNNVLKSVQVSNLAPGTAVSLTLKLADLTTATTALRADIRGVVKYNSMFGGPIVFSGGPGVPAIAASACTIMPTLELFDAASGVTQMFTSDTRPSGTPQIVPLTPSSTIVN